MATTNNYIRNYIKTIHDVSKRMLYGKVRSEDFFCSIIFRQICNVKFDSNFAPEFLNLSEEEQVEAILFQGLMETVMLMDLYISLNKKVVTETATTFEINLLNKISTCANKDKKDKYQSLFIDPNVGAKLVQASLDFLDSSAYEKVLSFKCLDAENVYVLTNISPYFTDDLIRYAIDINREFLIKQINKWKFATNEEEAINAASEFLINAFNMNIDIENLVIDIINQAETDDVLQALVDEDVQMLGAFILDYYRTYNQNGPKL